MPNTVEKFDPNIVRRCVKPSRAEIFNERLQELEQYALDAIKRCLECEIPKVELAAATYVIDRLYGRPIQHTDGPQSSTTVVILNPKPYAQNIQETTHPIIEHDNSANTE